MADKAPEPVKSTQQLDLEARQSEDYVSPLVKATTVGPHESLVDDAGFVGVDPNYANNANESDAPLSADSGAEKDLEDKLLGGSETVVEQKEEEKKEEAPKHAAPASSTPSTPSA